MRTSHYSLLIQSSILSGDQAIKMASINPTIVSFSLIILFVISIYTAESQNVRPAIPIDIQHKLSEVASLATTSTRSGANIFTKSVVESVVPSYLKDFLRSDLFVGNEEDVFANIKSPRCKKHIQHIWNELAGTLANLTTSPSLPSDYILHMIDSWGKFPSGILSGHLAVPGDFDECIKAKGAISATEEIRGKYCLGIFAPGAGASKEVNHDQRQLNLFNEKSSTNGAVSPLELLELMFSQLSSGEISMIPPLLPYVGTCFPASCSDEDISIFLSNVFRIYTSNAIASVMFPCQQEEKPPLDAGDYTMVCILGVISGLCFIGTLVDLLLPRIIGESNPLNKGKAARALKSFSVYTNTMKFLQTGVSSDNLGCLHGLRFLSMAWVVLGHTWITIVYQFQWNGVDLRQMYKSGWTMMAVLNATPSVDSFFVMAGALVTYNILRELDKTKFINVPLMYIHRYLRLTPTYAVMIGMMATIMPYIGNGPQWYLIEAESKSCAKNGWHNLFYINTLVSYSNVDGDSMCYGESWYLANDMLYFLVSPLLVYPLWRWKWAGLSLLGAWFLQSTIHNAVLIAKDDLTPTFIPFQPINGYIADIYMKPWTRSGPYAIGILLGYALHNLKKNPNSFPRLPRSTVWFLWTLTTGTALAVIFGPYRYFDPANTSENGSPASVTYGVLGRPVWAVVMAWIIFACVSDYGGPVNRFLSWKPFIPLGRLTYCVYMSSYHLQLIYSTITYHPVHYSIYSMVYLYLGHMVFFLLIGYILTITIESPFIHLEKLLFESVRRPKSIATKGTPPLADENQNVETKKVRV